MSRLKTQLNKKSQNNWFDYLEISGEPKTNSRYDISPELEDELLEHGVFLKQRVMRRARKLNRRQASRPRDPFYSPRRSISQNQHRHGWA